MASARRPSHRLLGLGLDATDQHKRITRGEGFSLVGGSEETHERMTENIAMYLKWGYVIERYVKEKGFDRVYMKKNLRLT